ncbi:hypothetical protein CBR_g8433 [Chara braunii]|uniref:CCHC-type domain-containing protein n=1 Tax=Chara braunii TaxID=69332 RepID=A0A388KM63_CHABU|nr:hypothetical protein CBR_g8433 [Chara braunii]|eukprot:GBG71132.1 hypothetical protein CBR_g8433 [Chara braunii]
MGQMGGNRGAGVHGAVGSGLNMPGNAGSSILNTGMDGQNTSPNGMPAVPFGVVTCDICGKNEHYARNCWQAPARQRPEEENVEMRELLLRIARREKEEEEKKKREIEEARRKEEDERRESEKIREEQAREAKLQATILRILAQKKEAARIVPAPQIAIGPKKRSPGSKAQMLREICSYIAESEEDSEEVKEEAEKLVEALESRKKSKKSTTLARAAVNRAGRRVSTPRKEKGPGENTPANDGVLETPKKVCPAECSSEGLVEFTLSQTKALSGIKAHEVRKIYSKEGIDYVKKDVSI